VYARARAWVWVGVTTGFSYEWLNSMESAQMRIDKEKESKKKKKKKEEEDAADRSTLWQGLLQLDTRSRETLQHLYSEQVFVSFSLYLSLLFL